MTSRSWRSRLVHAVLQVSMPERIATEAAADLLDDYDRVRAEAGAVHARVFLVREGLSLVSRSLWAASRRRLRASLLLKRDVVQAGRTMVRRPGSSAGVSLMLAAGLAAVLGAAGFTSALLFRPISDGNPDLLRIGAPARNGRLSLMFSEAELQLIRPSLAAIARTATVNLQPALLRVGETEAQTLAEVVSPRYFELAGFEMRVGRRLGEIDAMPGSAPVVVIGESLWRNRFANDHNVVGTTLALNGHRFTIVGVAAAHGSSTFLGASVDAWISLTHADTLLKREWRTDVNDRFWSMICDVDPSALAILDVALANASHELVTRMPERWRERRLAAFPGTMLAGSQRDSAVVLSLVLSAFAGLIFIAAGANVSGIFVAAAAAERSRAAVLLAIGAGRSAILRRHLVEGAVLGGVGGVIAVGLYGWIRIQLLNISLLPTLSLRLELPLEPQLAVLTLVAGAVTGLMLAIGPALWITRLDMAQTLRDGSARTSGTVALSRARRLLVGAQVAISVALVVSAALFVRSVSALSTLDLGFPRGGLIAMDFDLEPAAPHASALPGLAREALSRVSTLPGVVSATMSNRAPVDASTPAVTVTTPGPHGLTVEDVTYYLATAAYFDTIGLPIVRGRSFTEAEVDREADVAVINETLASRLWPNGDVLERAMTLQPDGRALRVIGVARDSKYRTLSEQSNAHFYLPATPAFGRSLLVRTHDDPRRTLTSLQRALDQVGPGLVGFFPRTFDDHLAVDMLSTTTAARVAVVLGVLALLLSGAGLYGIVTWFVAVRQREIAVRLALGASAFDVCRLVVGQAVSATAPGLVIGVTTAIAIASVGRSLFVGVNAVDPMALSLGIGAIAAVVLMASYLPSRRATRVDPVVVLRD
jgi:predicted permease